MDRNSPAAYGVTYGPLFGVRRSSGNDPQGNGMRRQTMAEIISVIAIIVLLAVFKLLDRKCMTDNDALWAWRMRRWRG